MISYVSLYDLIGQRDGTKITDFSKCDFTPMFEYFQAERERKKGMTKAEKDAIRIARDELEEKYRTCILDGRVERVGNFRVEPPSLFRGRGDHPKTGKLKVNS
jgi:DNA topoisomerase-1